MKKSIQMQHKNKGLATDSKYWGNIIVFPDYVDEWKLSACGLLLFCNFEPLCHYCSMRSSVRRWGMSHAESHTRQEKFFLADACRISAGAYNHQNIRDTVTNKRANMGTRATATTGFIERKHNECMWNMGWKHVVQFRNLQLVQAHTPFVCLFEDSVSHCFAKNGIHSEEGNLTWNSEYAILSRPRVVSVCFVYAPI